MKKIFLLKVAGLYGIIVSITSVLIMLLHRVNEMRVFSDASFLIDGYLTYLFLHILLVIISIVIYSIGKSRESYLDRSTKNENGCSLENQVVGVILLISALMNIKPFYRIVYVYLRHNRYSSSEITKLYLGQMFISVTPIIIYTVTGLLLLSFTFRKRVVYNLSIND